LRVELKRLELSQQLLHLGGDHRGRHAAGDFPCVVAAHAIGEHHQTIGRIRGNRVLVVRLDHARIGAARDFENLAVVNP